MFNINQLSSSPNIYNIETGSVENNQLPEVKENEILITFLCMYQ
jgi:hypothetical protein